MMPSRHNQQGAALIVVLLILILIITIGTVAVRRSTTDLKIATAAQVNDVLFQTNDAVFLKVEKEDRMLGGSNAGTDSLNGYITSNVESGGSISFCAKPRENTLFNQTRISQRNANGGLLSSNGFCNPSDPKDYINEGRAITQLTFIVPQITTDEGIFDREIVGTSSNDLESDKGQANSTFSCIKFIGYATTVIPSLSDAPLGNEDTPINDTSTIAGCFKQPRTGTNTVDTCLENLDVPFTTHVQAYRNTPSVKCIGG